jgi:hypothetical protein
MPKKGGATVTQYLKNTPDLQTVESIDLGNARLVPVHGIATTKIHSRTDLPADEAFSRALEPAAKKEKSFYERAVFKYAETLIERSGNPRAKDLLTQAKTYGELREKELKEHNLESQLGSPALRKLLRTLREDLRAAASSKLSIGADGGELVELYGAITKRLFEASRGKFGITVAGVDPSGVAQIEVRQVSSPAYFGLAKANMPAAWRERCMATGVCMVVKTADNKLLVQYRTANNAQYAEILGASIAGMFDAKVAEGYADTVSAVHRRGIAAGGQRNLEYAAAASLGIVGPITAESVLQQIRAEAREELGLKDKISGGQVVGIAEDLTKPHHEIVLIGSVSLSAAEIVTRAKDKYDKDAQKYDIPEWCVAIPATGEAVAALLTAVKVPIPPTHAAAFLAAGKSLVREASGAPAADTWEKETVAGYLRNLHAIDAICREVTNKPYDPMVKATAQGLKNPIPQLRAALVAIGLELTTPV